MLHLERQRPCGFPKEGLVLVREGALEGGAEQVGFENVWIGRRDAGMFLRPPEEGFRMPHQVLVQRVIGTDHDAEGALRASAAAARLLPRAGNSARVAGEESCIDVSYIDAELEGGGSGDSQQIAVEESRSIRLRSSGR